MAEKLGLDNQVRDLKLGTSFDPSGHVAFHSFRYDFKPASVDTTKMASVEIGEKNSMTVTVPHVEGAGTTHTVFKGNKRPCQKECVLIIDHKTGEITLEKLANNVQLKKTRIEGSSKAHMQFARPATPVEKTKDRAKTSPNKKKQPPPNVQSSVPSGEYPPNIVPTVAPPSMPVLHQQQQPDAKDSPESSSSSSSGDSGSSDSDDDIEEELKAAATHPAPSHASHGPPHHHHHHKQSSKPGYHSMLSEDLRLSESGSDSD